MPRRTTHALVGIGAGVLTAAARAKELREDCRIAELVGGALGGWLGGVLPDVIEPATTPNHRNVAHSVATGGGLSLAKVADARAKCREQAAFHAQRAQSAQLTEAERSHAQLMMLVWHVVAGAAAAFVAGYASHLALDALTKKSIPLIGG